MIEKVICKIDQLVEELYTPDQNKVNEYYLELIDTIGAFLDWMAKLGYDVDLRKDLEKIQQAVSIRDYILLSDLIKYEMRPDFVELKKQMNETVN